MKGRDSRKQTAITAVAATAGAAVTGAIIGISAVTPFAVSKASEAASKALEKHDNGIPAAKAKKKELDDLQAEKKQLAKDKAALEKKKANARKQQAKKIYEERVKNGYEASIPMLNKEADKAVADASKFEATEAKPKKQKVKKEKAKKSAPIIVDNTPSTPLIVTPQAPVEMDGEEPDYTASASMFKGISF